MKLIYVCANDVSVYESQVIALLEYISAQGVNVTLLQGYTNEDDKNKIKKKLSYHNPLDVVWFKNSPTYSIFEKSKIKNIYNAIIGIKDYEKAIIHVRSEYYGYILKKILEKYNLRNQILVDIRGVVFEEIKYKLEHLPLLKKIRFLFQKHLFKKTNNLLFNVYSKQVCFTSVSPLINDYIKENYPLCKSNLLFHPNIAGIQFKYTENGRIRIRKKYGFTEDDVVAICSTNSNSIWQKDTLVIQHLLEMGVKVLNLSKVDPQISGCFTTVAPFIEMPDYLSAADIAVLWRDDTFMNQSASPSKFSEFAVMGLYVIHNRSVSVATSYIERTGAGCLVNKVEDINSTIKINELIQNRRRWCCEGQKSFGIENLGQSYLAAYKKLL